MPLGWPVPFLPGCFCLFFPSNRPKKPDGFLGGVIASANSLSRSTASACDGYAGSGIYVSNETSPKRYDGWNPANSSSEDTLGSRSERATISVTFHPIAWGLHGHWHHWKVLNLFILKRV